MNQLEDMLRKAMQWLGPIVARFAERLAKLKLPNIRLLSGPKRTRSKRTGVTNHLGEDFGQLRWEERQIRSLLSGIESTKIHTLLPNLRGKKALHLTVGPSRYVGVLVSRGAEAPIEIDITKNSAKIEVTDTGDHPLVRGAVEKLPFCDRSFDFALYPSALAWRGDLPALIPELSRCLTNHGRVVLAVIHPFFEYLMNPRGGFQKGIGELFRVLRANHFFVEELQEGNLQEALKQSTLPSHFSEALKRFPGIPVILLVRAILVKRG